MDGGGWIAARLIDRNAAGCVAICEIDIHENIHQLT
jgi:hypothetical protein